jgi:hypothetical protein
VVVVWPVVRYGICEKCWNSTGRRANWEYSTTTAPTSISVRTSSRTQLERVDGTRNSSETSRRATSLSPRNSEITADKTPFRPPRLLRQGWHEAYVPHAILDWHRTLGLTFELDFHLLRNHYWAPTINIDKLYVPHER